MSENMQDAASGPAIRRAVLGDKHVDASASALNIWNSDLVDFVERYCWGEIWSRPQLPRATRSLLTIAFLTALNRPSELRAHVIGAINNGCEQSEIVEVVLQASVYCGVPAALDASRVVVDVFSSCRPERGGNGE